MNIIQSQKQSLSVNPKQIQQMSILQMGVQELAEYIYSCIIDNPVIDMDLFSSYRPFEFDFSSAFADSFSRVYDTRASDYESDLYEMRGKSIEQTLREYLEFQLYGCELSKAERKIANWLIGCIDSRGFLKESVEETAALLHQDITSVKKVFDLLKSFSPPGVCSADVRECLISQLEQSQSSELAIKIVSNYLFDAAQGHFNHIARNLHVSSEEVHDAIRIIKDFSPFPAYGFTDKADTICVIPDVQIILENGNVKAEIYNSYTPYIGISQYYRTLLIESDDVELRKYIEDNIKSAFQLIQNITQRESSVLRCAQSIASRQRSFFLGESNVLAPTSMKDVSDELGLDQSTVSRAIKDKYIYCEKGVFPMRAFFSYGSAKIQSEKELSLHRTGQFIAELIKKEDPQNPFSDQQICAALAHEGINISRRSVSELRKKNCIPSSIIRKKRIT